MLFLLLGVHLGNAWRTAGGTPAQAISEKPAGTSFPAGNLPRAMTATPREKKSETILLTDESLLLELRQQQDEDGSQITLQVQSVEISERGVRLEGWIEGWDLSGQVELSGRPVVRDGKLAFQVNDLSLEHQSLPEIVSAMLETEIQQIFEQRLWGYEVLGIQLGDGRIDLTVVGW